MSNVVQNIDGADVQFSDSVIASEIGEPMFHRYGELINVALIFFPVIFFVSMFWFIYGSGKAFINNTNLKSKKDLFNK